MNKKYTVDGAYETGLICAICGIVQVAIPATIYYGEEPPMGHFVLAPAFYFSAAGKDVCVICDDVYRSGDKETCAANGKNIFNEITAIE